MPITINAILKAKPGKAAQLREELLKVVPLSRAEAGNIDYILHESPDQEGVFVFYETWRDEEALQAHISADHFQAYRQNTEPFVETRELYRLSKIE